MWGLEESALDSNNRTVIIPFILWRLDLIASSKPSQTLNTRKILNWIMSRKRQNLNMTTKSSTKMIKLPPKNSGMINPWYSMLSIVYNLRTEGYNVVSRVSMSLLTCLLVNVTQHLYESKIRHLLLYWNVKKLRRNIIIKEIKKVCNSNEGNV